MFSIGDALKAAPRLFTAKKDLEIAELKSLLAGKEGRIIELEAERRLIREMEFRSGFYFSEGDACPFCQHCWEVDKARVHLGSPFKHTLGGFGYPCTRCKGVSRAATLHPGTNLEPTVTRAPIAVVTRRSSVRDGLDGF